MKSCVHNPLIPALAVLLAGCASMQSDSHKKTPVAVVAGQTIYEDEIIERVQGDLRKLQMEEYQVKQRALENYVLRKLLTDEARKRSLTMDQLLQQEVDARVPEPTEAELRAQYEQQQNKRKFEEVKEQYRDSLKQSRVRAARQAYFQTIWNDAGVQVLLQPPRTPVAGDPARRRGTPDAPVQIVEFSDFQCPFCRRVQPTLTLLLAKYQGQVSLSHRDFPLREIHAEAQSAAEASRCALEQGKFWEFHDIIFNDFKFDPASIKGIAQRLSLDLPKFDACLASGKYRAAIEQDLQEGRSAGIDSTPAFFINGIYIGGAQPLEEFERIIRAELALKKP